MVEIEVEFEYVDAWLTQDAELACLGVLRYQIVYGALRDVPLLCYASYLVLRRCRCDVWIQAGGRGCNQVDGNIGAGMVCVRCSSVSLYAVDELLVRRRIVGATGVRGVITIACC